ncbi:MAG: ABC transporter permease [Christensenellales bacterium]|nr:ABC transporter permease [Christensenellales bacterium]
MKRSWYAAPYALWMMMFTVVPLLFVCYYALTTRTGDFTLENVGRIIRYAPVLLDSLRLALYCTALCLVIGYPAAYFLSGREMSRRGGMVVLILLPMWMNFLLRTYAMMTLFENNGVLNVVLGMLGLPKQRILGTEGAVLAGMVYNFLPFMILPVYTVLKKIDPRVIEAAEDLGCNSIQVVTRVVLPQSLPGIVSGITMVFMPAVTTFAISRLMSSGMIYLMGDMIEEYYITLNNRHVGSAMALVMMVLILLSMSFLRRADPKGEGGGLW